MPPVTRQLLSSVFFIVIARRAVEVDALQLRRPKGAELSDPVLDPSALVAGIIAPPHSFYRREIVDHHNGTAALVPN